MATEFTSTVRQNLMTQVGYTPYCGNMMKCFQMPRTQFNGTQFECPSCGWTSNYEQEFIAAYKEFNK